MKPKTYKELLDGMSYRELGYTGTPSVTDPKLKAFNDTILKNDEISQTKINTTPIFKGQRRVANNGAEVETGADVQTATDTTVLTAESPYSDFEKWIASHGYDTKKFLSDAMAQADQQYAQARATYGLQAEQLAQAGLTNSGVSDNMERVAYAQKVQAEQAALDQKAALDQANKEGFATYQEEQKQKQQQYNDAYMTLRKGYEDDNGVYHPPVSHEMAVAQLKYAGLNDETLLANTQAAYGEYEAKETANKEAKQNAIAGIDTTTGGFSADSMLGKLFDGTLNSEDFLDQIQKDYVVRFDTDEEAVDALFADGVITKEQYNMYYKNLADSSLEAIVKSGLTAKAMLKNDDSELINAINNAHEAYKSGKMTKADWDTFRKSLLSGDAISFTSTMQTPMTWLNDRIMLTLRIGNTQETLEILNSSFRRASAEQSKDLDTLSDGTNFAYTNGNLYIKTRDSGANNEQIWVRVGNVSGTAKKNIVQMLKLLAEG